jgi:quercetin dioxygenase-like cupin family protein
MRRIPLVLLVAVVAVGALALTGAQTFAGNEQDDVHAHGTDDGLKATSERHPVRPDQVTLLTGRASSPDSIAGQFRWRIDGTGPTHVMNLNDIDHVMQIRIDFEPGQFIGWHSHPGPVLGIVAEGTLTFTTVQDCVPRPYGPNELMMEHGPGDNQRVDNLTDEPAVAYVTFFELPAEGPFSIPEEDPC